MANFCNKTSPFYRAAPFLLGVVIFAQLIVAPAKASMTDQEVVFANRQINSFKELAFRKERWGWDNELHSEFRDIPGTDLIRFGITYAVGDGIEQNLENAAILLGAVQAFSKYDLRYDGPDLEYKQQIVLAHAAYVSAFNYLKLESSWGNENLLRFFLRTSADARNQQALITMAMRKRKTRFDANMDRDIRGRAAREEGAYLRLASRCTKENTTRKIIPWRKEICRIAADEAGIASRIGKQLGAEHDAQLAREGFVALGGSFKKNSSTFKSLNLEESQPNLFLVGAAGLAAIMIYQLQSGQFVSKSDEEWRQEQIQREERMFKSTNDNIDAYLLTQ